MELNTILLAVLDIGVVASVVTMLRLVKVIQEKRWIPMDNEELSNKLDKLADSQQKLTDALR